MQKKINSWLVTQLDDRTETNYLELDSSEFLTSEIVIEIKNSAINYKDALAITGQAPIIRKFPKMKDVDEKILSEAKLQRESLLKEAREIRSRIIADAESEAMDKANKLIESAKTAIENEKSAAMKELNNTVVDLSLNIAEKLLTKELDDKETQLENIQEILENIKLN